MNIASLSLIGTWQSGHNRVQSCQACYGCYHQKNGQQLTTKVPDAFVFQNSIPGAPGPAERIHGRHGRQEAAAGEALRQEAADEHAQLHAVRDLPDRQHQALPQVSRTNSEI